MTPNEHVALTGHVQFRMMTLNDLIKIGTNELGNQPTNQDSVPDYIGDCAECGYPVTYSAMIADEEEFASTMDWIEAVRAQHYVNQIELSANGYDSRIPTRWTGGNHATGQNP